MKPPIDLRRLAPYLRRCCGPDLDVDDVGVSYVKWRRSGPVLARLEAESTNGTVVVTARWVGASKGERWARSLNERAGIPPGAGAKVDSGLTRPAVYASELGVLLTAFPNDRRLPSLALVCDPQYLVGRVSEALAPTTGSARITDLDIHPVRYKPEGKCVLRLTPTWHGTPTASLPAVIYAKVTKPSIYERSRSLDPALGHIAAGTGFTVPTLLAAIDDLSLELWSALGGKPLSALIGSGPQHQVGRSLGSALRSLHDLPISLDQVTVPGAAVELAVDNAAQLAWHLPHRAEQAQALGSEVARRLTSTPASLPAPTHHDFHSGNVLVDGRALSLLDFEDLAMGDPADDLGSMYADLTALAVRAPERTAAILVERAAFLDAYDTDALGPRVVTRASMHCLLRAYQAVRYPEPGTCRQAEAMLDAAEALQAGALQTGSMS